MSSYLDRSRMVLSPGGPSVDPSGVANTSTFLPSAMQNCKDAEIGFVGVQSKYQLHDVAVTSHTPVTASPSFTSFKPKSTQTTK